MNFKKKLFMMFLATSMVVPSNLALVASVTTPVLAEDDDEDTEEEISPSELMEKIDKETNTLKLDKNYKVTYFIQLKFDPNPGKSLIPGDTIIINLNGHTLDFSEHIGGDNAIEVGNGINVTIKNGTLKSNTKNGIETLGEGSLTLDKVELDFNDGWGICIFNKEKTDEAKINVNISNSSFKGKTGFIVSKDIKSTSNYPTVKLDKVTMDCKEVGIYQSGYSKLTVQNCPEIKGKTKCGIETCAGTLTVTKSKLVGGTALVISTNPQDNESPKEVSISISNSQLSGSEYDVAYAENVKDVLNSGNGGKIKLDSNTYASNKVKIFKDGDEDSEITDLSNLDNTIFNFKDKSSNRPTTTKPSSGSSSGSSSHKPATPKPEEPSKPVLGAPTTMYRLYNRLTGEHLYTTNKAERDQLLTSDTWKDENQGWIAPSVSDYPVYRLLNPNTGDHHYTMDKNEFDTLQILGWIGEDIAFFSADKEDSDNVILHRLYNPNAQETGMHHYTTNENERDALVSQGWTYEGTAWAGLKSE